MRKTARKKKNTFLGMKYSISQALYFICNNKSLFQKPSRLYMLMKLKTSMQVLDFWLREKSNLYLHSNSVSMYL